MSRKNPVMVGFRLGRIQKATLEELAERKSIPVCRLLFDRVMPWAEEEWKRLQAGDQTGPGGSGS